jgi:hypothetical protein
MAAMLGALPLAIGLGEGSELRQPARHRDRRRPDPEPGPDALHDTGDLSLCRQVPRLVRASEGRQQNVASPGAASCARPPTTHGEGACLRPAKCCTKTMIEPEPCGCERRSQCGGSEGGRGAECVMVLRSGRLQSAPKLAVILSRFRKSVPRFSDKNLRQIKDLSRTFVGVPRNVCLASRRSSALDRDHGMGLSGCILGTERP